MRTKLFVAVAALFLFALTFYVPREASAVPAFARQTGMACNSCHYQHFPTLNAFGRAFKANGYTMVGGQSLIEGDFLSLPSTLNASLVTKIRYQKTNGTTAGGRNKGILQFPDEAGLLIGGRVGENIGFLLESSLIGTDNSDNFASFKMPFTFGVGEGTKVSIIPFTTDAAGPAYAFELLNTGAVRVNRPIEHREEISAQQFLGTDVAATGIAFVVQRELYYANYTMWSNVHGDTDAGPYLHYARLAFTPTYAGWDLGAGVQWWGGTSKRAGAYEKADVWAIDAQAQGTVGSFPVGVYLSYGKSGKTDGATANIFNANTTDDAKAFGTLVEVGVIPGRLTLAAGYITGDATGSASVSDAGMNGNTAAGAMNAFTLGANYALTQNVNLVWNSSFYGGDSFDPTPASRGDQLHTAMVFAAF